MEAVNFEFVAQLFKEPQLALRQSTIRRRDIAADRIGGFIEFFGQGVGDEAEERVKPVFLFEQFEDDVAHAAHAVGIVIGENRKVIHDLLDIHQLGRADRCIRDGYRHHQRDKGIFGAKFGHRALLSSLGIY